MKLPRRLLRPNSWPVRWRLAFVSSALTLVILLLFGGLIGKIATDRIRDDFDGEVSSAAKILAGQTQILYPLFQEPQARLGPQWLDAFVRPDGASVHVYDVQGNRITSNPDAAPLGPPEEGLGDFRGMRVATEPVLDETGSITGYVQYGRGLDHVDATVERIWLLIAAGILGGTLLAIFAGVTIAGRAMRPIATLTATAREIAATRDPSQRMPKPRADDEVGELTRTLEEMLRSLDAARAEREGVMQKQREFVADASHELRTPLTSILANLELLQASLDRAEQAEDREIVDSALRSSKRMGRLVGDLLLLARADAGRMAPHRRVDLAEVAGDAAAEAAPLMG
ncbi:MAG: HAMP domain-containing protein, partial [Actinomycetota bacterium]|nr:HAMP domain-containing protein [Actinomycetota bacterium]